MGINMKNLVFKKQIKEYGVIRKIFPISCKCISSETKWHSPNDNRFITVNRNFQNKDNARRNFRFYLYGIVPIVGYYLYKRKYFNINVHILPSVKAATRPSLRSQYNFIADIVELSGSAVVGIDINDTHRLDFFAWNVPTVTNGSGFIVEEDGLILTNAHVVMGHPQSAIQVKMADGSVYPGKVEDIDVKTDLASIRIKPKHKLPVLRLGDSKDLRPGEWVIAMGSPLMLSNTVTAGIVSSVCRKSSELQLYGKDMHYIQTDASITFGNSGGPLINLDGMVVGINSMKVAQAGISFAIPIEYAVDFLKRSKERKTSKGGTTKRYLGLTMLTLNEEILHELQFRNQYMPRDLTEGILVWKIVIGSPAHKCGLMPGDIVTEVNGIHVKSSQAIYEALEKDAVLNMKIYRGNMYFEVTLYPEEV